MDQIGRYKIEAEIGHGGFGRVYRAFDPNFSRHVAIKVLSSGADKDLLTRFRNEAIAVGKLQHKNIVIVHDFGEIGDTPYLVMEYLEGQDLQKVLRSHRPMNLLEKVTIMDQVAAGLHHAHRNGIVHRDVKPGNVMILRDGSVKIMDFGIARLVQDRGTRVTQHGNVIGTVQYMAPEQFRGGDVDSRCDVFAYGVIYYELITGHHPFDAPDMPRIFYNVTMVDPPPVRSLAPECPAALEEIIARTLKKDREFRYQTLEDVLFDVAPIRLGLERDFGLSLVRKAERLFSESNIAEAQQVIREALQFDPNNSDARQVRERIQRHAERVAGRERARQLIEAGRRDVINRDFDKALQQFEAARRVDTDNLEIDQLIASVRSELEKTERAAMLLAKARHEFEARDITGAYQDVLECLQCQPDSTEAKALLGSIRREIERRERERRFAEGISTVESHLAAGDHEQALALLADLDISYPGSSKVQELNRSATEAKQEKERKERIAQVLERARKLVSESNWRDAVGVLEGVQKDQKPELAVQSLLAYCREELTAQEKAAEVESAIREARKLSDAFDFDNAISRIDRSLARYPGELALQAAHDRTVAARQEQRRREGIDAACADAERYSKSGDLRRAITCLEGAADVYGHDSRLESALSEYRDRLSKQQRAAALQSIVSSATSLLRQDDFQPALKIIREGLDNYPEEPTLTALMSRATVEQSEFNRRRGIKVALDRVHDLKQKREFEQAEEALQRALRTLPNEAELLAELEVVRTLINTERSIAEAQRLLTNGDIAGARVSIEPAAANAADDSRVRTLQDQIRSAADEQERRERIAKTLAEARALAESDKAEAALAMLQRALDRDPQEAQLRSFKAYVEETIKTQRRERDIADRIRAGRELIQSGSHGEAIRALEAALRVYPDEPALTGLLARAREQQAVEQQADIERSVASANAARARGDFETALALVNSALQLHPNESSLLVLQQRTLEERATAEQEQSAEFERRNAAATAARNAEAALKRNGAPAAELIETPSSAIPDVSRPAVRVSPEPRPAGSRKVLWLGGGMAVAGLVIAFVMMRPKTAEVPPPVQDLPRREEPTLPKPSVAPPKVLRFEPNRTTAAAGQPVEICYGVENVKSVRLDPPIQSIEPAAGRCFSFAPKTAGEYTLIAVGNNGEEISQRFRIDISDAPVVKPGTLVVQVAEGTTVTINGRRYAADRTNSVTVPLERGQYTVGVEREGYAALPPRLVRIEPERTEKLAFTLTPMPATLSIAGVPPGTAVVVDNRPVGTVQGTGSFQVQPGKHSVLLTSNGFAPKRVDIDAQPGATVVLGPPAVSLTPVRTEPVPPPVNPGVVAAQRWEQLQSSRDIAALEEFRRSNPGQYGDNAARRIEQLEWENARAAKNAGSVRAFLAKYPSSSYSDEAKQMLQQLEWAAVDRNDLAAVRAYVSRVPNGPFTQQAMAEIKRLEAGERSVADRRGVMETLNRVEASYAAKDYKQLTDVWPNAPRTLRDTFKDAQSITFTLTPAGAAEVSGDNAVVVCQRNVQTNFPGKKLPPVNDRVTVRLQRSGSGWQIVAIQ